MGAHSIKKTGNPSWEVHGQRLREHGLRAWIDEGQLTPGSPWMSIIERGIQRSAALAVLVGGDGRGPAQEVDYWMLLNHAWETGKPLIPVLLAGAPDWPELPSFLRERVGVDLREGLTAAAIDRLVRAVTGTRCPAPKLSARGPRLGSPPVVPRAERPEH